MVFGSSPSHLQTGQAAPDFRWSRPDGSKQSLHELSRDGSVVVFFYPKDFTPGCTAEACGFRDQYEAFTDAGATVIGVSADSDTSHESFAAKHNLPFDLVSDEDGALRKLFGVKRAALGAVPGRVTFVIGRGGELRKIFSSNTNMGAHVDEALAAVVADQA